MPSTENMPLNPPNNDDVIVYESGEDTDTWDLQPEEFWRGDDESDLAESESEEEEEEATAIEREMDAYADRLREKDSQSFDESDFLLADVEEYAYEPLQHLEARTTIRLIHLRPSANFDSPLVCTFSTTSIGHDGGDLPCYYEAVSYIMGAAVFPELLFIVGLSKSKSFMLPITQNLHDALKHLRRKDKDMALWVDAVCINQADTEEKDRQLGIMSKIYRYSVATHAWLGLDSTDHDGEICLKLIEAIASSTIEQYGLETGNADNFNDEVDMPETRIDSRSEKTFQGRLRRDLKGGEGDKEMSPNSPKATGKESNKVSKLDGHGSDVSRWNKVISGIITSCGNPDPSRLLRKFFDREYFKRRWTVQERYYASVRIGLDMHCGRTTVTWRPYKHENALRRLQEWMMAQGNSQGRWRPRKPTVDGHGEPKIIDERLFSQTTINQVKAVIKLVEKYFSEGYDTVLSFMERHADAQCADPRDKVLSLIDVLADEYDFPLMPAPTGYGTSVRDVYIAFSRALYFNSTYFSCGTHVLSRHLVDDLESRLELQRILVDMLAAAGSMKQLAATTTEIETMPSWVLDWRQKPSHDTTLGLQSYYQQTMRERIYPFVFGRIGVHGLCSSSVLFDEIRQVINHNVSKVNIEKHIRYVASMCIINNVLSDTYKTRTGYAKEELGSDEGQNPNHYMSWRWCFCDVPVEEVTALTQYSLSDRIVTIMNAIANALVLSSHRNYIDFTSVGNRAPRRSRHKYLAEKGKAMAGRTLHITKRGFIGVGPASSMAGDQIWMLTQSNSPFVLRPVQSPFFNSGSSASNEKEEWSGLGFSGQPCTASLIGAAHLFPSSHRDLTAIIEGLETSELCML